MDVKGEGPPPDDESEVLLASVIDCLKNVDLVEKKDPDVRSRWQLLTRAFRRDGLLSPSPFEGAANGDVPVEVVKLMERFEPMQEDEPVSEDDSIEEGKPVSKDEPIEECKPICDDAPAPRPRRSNPWDMLDQHRSQGR